MTATVSITRRGAERVRARHCWVYRSDLEDRHGASGGEVVRVAAPGGEVIGRALYSSTSQIALRFVAFEDCEVDREFWAGRLEAADRYRSRVVTNSTAYRLVYGESDLLPSLIIDRYNDCFVIQTLSQGMDRLRQMWIELLIERYRPRAVVERNEGKVRDLEGLPRRAAVAYGSPPGDIVVEEHGVRFAIDLVEGQKTGAFLDQRENRIAAGSYARGRSLDCFTCEGGFALHMARTADHVLAVDVSAPAINRARRNCELNGTSSVEAVEANVFDYLRELDNNRERFDTIVLDPPAFAKNRPSLEGAIRGYKEINLRAMKLLNGAGTLITSSCSYHLSEAAFLNLLTDAAADVGRSAKIIEKRTQSRDHPILLSMPESHYLKCIVMQID